MLFRSSAVPTNIPVEGDTEEHATAAIKALQVKDINSVDWCSSTNTISNVTVNSEIIAPVPSGKIICIAVPSHYVVTSVINGFNLESITTFTSSSVKYKLADGTYQDYTIYSFSNNASSNFDWKTVIINKA